MSSKWNKELLVKCYEKDWVTFKKTVSWKYLASLINFSKTINYWNWPLNFRYGVNYKKMFNKSVTETSYERLLWYWDWTPVWSVTVWDWIDMPLNAYLDCGNDSKFQITDADQWLTVWGRISSSLLSWNRTAIYNKYKTSWNQWAFMLDKYNWNVRFFVSSNWSSYSYVQSAILVDTMYLVMWVLKDWYIYLYIDNVLVGSSVYSSSVIHNSTANLEIGRTFENRTDDMTFWQWWVINRWITDEERNAIWNVWHEWNIWYMEWLVAHHNFNKYEWTESTPTNFPNAYPDNTKKELVIDNIFEIEHANIIKVFDPSQNAITKKYYYSTFVFDWTNDYIKTDTTVSATPYNGTVVGWVTVVDGAIVFDGSSGYVDIWTQSATTAMSICLDITPNMSGSDRILGFGKTLLQLSNTNVVRSPDIDTSSETFTTAISNWSSINIVLTQSWTTANLYINWILIETKTWITSIDTASRASTLWAYSWGSHYNWSIKSAKLYDKVLTATEVINSYNWTEITDWLVLDYNANYFAWTAWTPTSFYDIKPFTPYTPVVISAWFRLGADQTLAEIVCLPYGEIYIWAVSNTITTEYTSSWAKASSYVIPSWDTDLHNVVSVIWMESWNWRTKIYIDWVLQDSDNHASAWPITSLQTYITLWAEDWATQLFDWEIGNVKILTFTDMPTDAQCIELYEDKVNDIFTPLHGYKRATWTTVNDEIWNVDATLINWTTYETIEYDTSLWVSIENYKKTVIPKTIYSWVVIWLDKVISTSGEYVDIKCMWEQYFMVKTLYVSWWVREFNKTDDPKDILQDILWVVNTVHWTRFSWNVDSMVNFGSDINIDFDNDTCFSAMNKVLDNVNYYLTIDWEWIVYFKPYASSAKHSLTFRNEISELEIKENSTNLYNDIILAWDSATNTWNDSDSVTKYGTLSKFISDSTIKDSDTADERILAELDKLSKPSSNIRILVNNNYHLETLEVWDIVEIKNTNLVIDKLPIQKINYNQDSAVIYIDGYTSLEKSLSSI